MGVFLDKYKKKDEEEEFQIAYKKMATKMGLSLDSDDPRHFYDWRSLYKEDPTLTPDPEGHFPSKHKQKGHPREFVGEIDTKTGKPIKEEFSFLNKYKFTADVGLDVGAKAEMGTTLLEEPKPLIEGLPISKPEDRPTPLFQDPKMMELHRINFESFKLWFKELKEVEDKVAFLKGEGQSPELKELRRQYKEKAPYMYRKSEQWIENVSMIAVGVGMAWQLVNVAVTSGFKVKDKVMSAEELKGVLSRARAAYVTETGKFKATLSDNDFAVMKQLNVFFKTSGRGTAARNMLEKIVEKTGGLSFPQQVNIFGGKLYAGLPADEIVKSLVKVGKVTADMVKGLDPVKVSQVTQQLLNINPALANEFLKAIEKPVTKEEIYAKKYGIPVEKVKITELPPTAKEEIKEIKKVPPKIPEGFVLEPTKEELAKIEAVKPITAKEKFEEAFRKAKIKGFAEKPKVEPKIEKLYELKKDLSTEQKKEGSKLIGRIQGLVSSKGLTKVEFTTLKRRYGLSPHLATDTRRMTMPQLEAVLKAVEKARPKRIGWQRVVTPKTEKKIQSLKTTLIDKLQMTEEAYQTVLKDVGVYKEPKYVDAKKFITEKQGKDVIYRLIDESNILRVTIPFDKAVTENKPIKVDVDKIVKRIKVETDRELKDPHELSSMRVNIQRMETITGAPIYPLYQDLINAHLKNKQKLGSFIKGFEPYKEILKNEIELKKVNDYILAKSNLKDKPSIPENITEKEIKLAKKIEGILKDYEAKARTEKFLDNIDHPEDMPQYLEYKKEIDKAKDIYESRGYDDLIEYMKTQKWGVIKSGYSPLQVLSPKIRLYKPKAQTFGKGHIKVRTDIEYHEQDKNIIQRLFSYKKQMDNLVTMRPKVRALITLIDKNISKFKDPPRISRNMETFFRELKGYNRPENWFDRGLNRLYAQAMQTIIMPSPVLSGRNLLQNIAFGHDKSLLIDPRNKSLTADELEYFHTYISQLEAMKADWLMIGEKPLPIPGLGILTRMVRKIGIYPYSDLANRHWGYWAKINQVKRAFAKNVSLDRKMKAAKFSDMELIEQKMALQILAKDGEESMARYVARVYVDNTQFLYDRSQRSLAEMGRVGKWAGNLMLFPRAYWEMLLKQSKKMTGKYVPIRERIRAFKVLAAVIGGGILVGAAYKKVTGRKENPYDPLVLLAYEPGGLAIGTVTAVTDVYVNILMATKGDDRALAALTTAIPKAADMFIPFYAYTLRALEASTDTKNIDRKALRKIRMLIDKEYELRDGAYELERKAMEKWQYFLSGAGIDIEIKEREVKKKEIISPYLEKYKETVQSPISSYLKKYK